MNLKYLILIVLLSSACVEISARKLIVFNQSQKTLEVIVIPQGIMSLSQQEKTRALKNRFSLIKPKKSAQLKVNNFESIDIKVFEQLSNTKYWYKYDREKTADLFNFLISSKKDINITLSGAGDNYQVQVGKKSITGTVPLYSVIERL